MRRRILAIFLFGVFFHQVYAGVPVVQLEEGWLVFDNSYKTYVPYIPDSESPKVLYYSLKPKKFQQDTLQFMSEKGLCIYFDYRLIYQNTERGARLIKIPIQKLVPVVVADSVLLAFYRKEGINISRLDAKIVTEGKPTQETGGEASFVNVIYRTLDPWSMTLMYTVLAVVVLLVLSKAVFPEGVSFRNLMGSMSAGSSDPLNGLLWVKVLINALCITTFAYFILKSPWAGDNQDIISGVHWAHSDIKYSSILFWAIVLHVIKFIYNYICANVSNMRYLLQSQNFMFVNLFYILNLVLLSFLVVCNVSPELSAWLIMYSSQVIGFYFFIPILILVINIIKVSGFRNVYLFSYICTAEVLPLIMALKFLA